MSHTVRIQAQFKTEHLASLKRALEQFGWKTVENAKARTYGGLGQQYPMIAQNPENGYDLGLTFNEKTGEIEVMGDFYGGSIAKTLGNNMDKLKQEYACCVAEDHFAYMGWTAERTVQEDGTIMIEGQGEFQG